jgi:formate--tetrahydrofolate ligase
MLDEDPDEVRAGATNLAKQIENVRIHGVSPVVAINAFPSDYQSELDAIAEIARESGARVAVTTHVADGGKGGIDLAREVAAAADEPGEFRFLYPSDAPLREKIEIIATRVYGADGVDYAPAAEKALDRFEESGFGDLPICLAKTHLSLSSDPKLTGAPRGWRLPVREVRASVGAGFIYPIAGSMQTMPGLGKYPAAQRIDLDEDGEIVGLS